VTHDSYAKLFHAADVFFVFVKEVVKIAAYFSIICHHMELQGLVLGGAGVVLTTAMLVLLTRWRDIH
jgi:hypothetical protein